MFSAQAVHTSVFLWLLCVVKGEALRLGAGPLKAEMVALDRERERAREREREPSPSLLPERSQFPYPPIIDMRHVPLMHDLQNTNNCRASISVPRCVKSQCSCIIVAIILAFIMMHRLRSTLFFGARCVCCNYTLFLLQGCTVECVPLCSSTTLMVSSRYGVK